MTEYFKIRQKWTKKKRPKPPKRLGRLGKIATFGNRSTPSPFLEETESEATAAVSSEVDAAGAVVAEDLSWGEFKPEDDRTPPKATAVPAVITERKPPRPCERCASALFWRYTTFGVLRCGICDPPVQAHRVRSWRMVVELEDGSPAWEVFVPIKLR